MKTFLITGGYGFIGSCFVLNQIKNGNKVINLDKITYAANIDSLKEVEKNANYQFVKGDICNNDLVRKILQENEINYLSINLGLKI